MISPEIKQKFLEKNGISIEDAISHIKTWQKEGKIEDAKKGLQEIKDFAPNLEEIKELEALFNDKPVKSAEAEEVVIEKKYPKEERILSALAYFSFLAILPLVLKKESALCQHHGKQGLIFSLFFFILGTIANFIPFLGGIMGGISSFIQLIVLFAGGAFAMRSKLWKAPMVYGISKNINL